MFFKVMVIKRKDKPDPVLDIDMFYMSSNELIVGLLTIS